MKVPAGKISLSEALQKYLQRRRDRVEDEASPEEAYDAASELRRAFERGELEARVWDESRGQELRLTPTMWRKAFFPERSFFGGEIEASRGDPLADYNRLHPYVDEVTFDNWRARQFGDGAPSTAALTQKAVNRSMGRRPQAKENALWALRELFPEGIPSMKSAALVEVVNAKLEESGKSMDTVSRAIGARSDHRKTAN